MGGMILGRITRDRRHVIGLLLKADEGLLPLEELSKLVQYLEVLVGLLPSAD